MYDVGREQRLKNYFATLSLGKLEWYKEQYENDAWMEVGFGLDNRPSLEKVKWIEEEIKSRAIKS